MGVKEDSIDNNSNEDNKNESDNSFKSDGDSKEEVGGKVQNIFNFH